MVDTTSIRSETSIHVRRSIVDRDEASWLWLVARLTPMLELQARYRLRGTLSRLCEPADLLNDVWLRAYPRLRDLRPREGRMTPVLLRFLSQILLYRVNELLRQHLRRGAMQSLSRTDSSGGRAAVDLPDERWSSVTRQASRSEVRVRILAALSELSGADREVLVLRGVEQIPNSDAAERLGVRPGTLAMRYKRALVRLRRSLPAGWIDDVF